MVSRMAAPSAVPYRFSWFIERKLAGMAWPKDETIPYLADHGIKVLVNLTTEPTSYKPQATELEIECITIGIADFCPPTTDQVKELIQLIDRTDGAVGIHCAMGCGRTGTMLACYLVAKEGYTAEVAIDETRKRRRNSIETRRQEQSVRDYERNLKGEDSD